MISIEQIRAARALLNWSQKDLADAAGLSQTGIARIENGAHQPTAQTLNKITTAFRNAYLEFIPDGVRKTTDIVTVREGANCYLELMDDALRDLAGQDVEDREILFWAADERRSATDVIEKTRQLRRAGIPMRFLIQEGNDYTMGKRDEYRWLETGVFEDSDVRVIFGHKVSYVISWHEHLKIITIKDRHIASESRKLFNFFWKNSKTPPATIATIRYENEDKP